MPYQAKVIEVMIASPSDVSEERRIVVEVIYEWNAVHAKERKTILMPIGWETHAVPDMGDRPQAIINAQLLKDADLLIGIFWTRIGSPTGVAPSGTVEEIEEHIKAEKSAMIYFSTAPVVPDRLDKTQYSELCLFKESLRGRGLLEEYVDADDFRRKLNRQLSKKVIAQYPTSSLAAENVTSLGVKTLALVPPFLLPNAKKLIVEASKDPGGEVLKLRTMGGTSIQTNSTQFVNFGDARSEAEWIGAIEELIKSGLLEDRTGKGKAYYVTAEGYRVADQLK